MEKMKSAPLQLSSLFFTTVRISAQPNHRPDEGNRFDLDVNTDVFGIKSDKPRSRGVILNVKIKPEDGASVGYLGEVELFGNFTVADSWPEDKIDKLIYINGSGMLYAAAREMICTITARGPWDMMIIPSWSFGQMYAEQEEAKKKEAEGVKQPTLDLSAKID